MGQIQYQNPGTVSLVLDGESQGGSPEVFRERVIPCAGASGGSSYYHKVAAGSGDAASIKASAGQLYGVHVFNNAGYPVFVKFYDTASAPTVGTTTVVFVTGVQAGQARDVVIPAGLAFTSGIGIAIVKGIADSDATSVAASDCVVSVAYK